MKNFRQILAALMLCMASTVPFTSCSNDESDDEPGAPAANIVAGSYCGDMICSVMGSESVFEDKTVTLTATDDATVSLVVPSFGNPPMQVPEITITGIGVTGDNGEYTLAATDFDQEVDGRKCSGVVKGRCTGNQLTIQYNLQFGAMPMPLICSITASKNN